jgi:hypothetical protein
MRGLGLRTSSLSGKPKASATSFDPAPELALSSTGVRRCPLAAVAVVTQYVTQLRLAGPFVPKPSCGVDCQGYGMSDLGSTVYRCPLASVVVGGDSDSLGYSVAHVCSDGLSIMECGWRQDESAFLSTPLGRLARQKLRQGGGTNMFMLIFMLIRLMIYAVVGMFTLMFWVLRMMVMLVTALATAISSAHASRKHAQLSHGRHAGGQGPTWPNAGSWKG